MTNLKEEHIVTFTIDEEKPKDLICINYPGIVKNDDKMIETFGGITTFSEALCDPKNKKLDLWFRPHDRLCKPATATANYNTSNTLLLKIKVRKKSKEIISHEVVGRVNVEYSFSSLCDFQYLALDNGVGIYDTIFPSKLDPDWFQKPSPAILLPGELSRSDAIQGFTFSNKKSDENEASVEIIATSRRKRFGLAIFLGFEENEVPTGPNGAIDIQKAAAMDKEIKIVNEILEKRPCVTKCAIAGLTGLSQHTLRDVLPYVAYHFHNGPWRANWVRYGYDPRKDPAARFWQTLDYRLHTKVYDDLLESNKEAKAWPLPPLKRVPAHKLEGAFHDLYILKPGGLPPSRQFFYQFCDIDIPEVKTLISSVEVRTECHPGDGWFPELTAQACRTIVRKYVMEALNEMNSKEGDEASLCLDDYMGSSDVEQVDSDGSDYQT